MQISETSYAVTGLGATPPWVVNSGFIVGKEKTLIVDTGMNLLAAQTIYGYATSIRPKNQLLAVNLEPHFDHIGGNSFFHSQGVNIYGHAGIKRTEEDFQATKDEYNQSILNPVRNNQYEADAFFVGTDVVNPTHSVAGGDKFDLGDIEVEILATPGHTALNLSVYNPRDEVLFCGDCIVSAYLPNLETGIVNDWRSWLESLDVIEALAPKIISPGHGNIIRGSEVQTEISRMRGIIREAIAQNKAPTAS